MRTHKFACALRQGYFQNTFRSTHEPFQITGSSAYVQCIYYAHIRILPGTFTHTGSYIVGLSCATMASLHTSVLNGM